MNVQTLISLSSVDPIWSGSPPYFITSSLQQIQIETPLLLLPRPQSLQRGWVLGAFGESETVDSRLVHS